MAQLYMEIYFEVKLNIGQDIDRQVFNRVRDWV
jgi:hypothetical protein